MLTPEQLAELRRKAARRRTFLSEDVSALLDHIDALTTERDELRATVERVRALTSINPAFMGQAIRAALNGDNQ